MAQLTLRAAILVCLFGLIANIRLIKCPRHCKHGCLADIGDKLHKFECVDEFAEFCYEQRFISKSSTKQVKS